MKKFDYSNLSFIYKRLVDVYGESENIDYMLTFRDTLNNLIERDKSNDAYKFNTGYNEDERCKNFGIPNKNAIEISRDAEIKINMVKDMVCSVINSGRVSDTITNEQIINEFCNMADQIFNRFNK